MSVFNPATFRSLPGDASDVIPFTQSTEDAWLMDDDEYLENDEDDEDDERVPAILRRESTLLLSQAEPLVLPARESMYVRMFAGECYKPFLKYRE